MNWNDLLDEVRTKGFNNTSAIARLAYSCETGNGIDQHAAEDIREVAEELDAIRAELTDARKVIGMYARLNNVVSAVPAFGFFRRHPEKFAAEE